MSKTSHPHGQHADEDQQDDASAEPAPLPTATPTPAPARSPTLEERVAKLEAWIPRLEAIVGSP